MRLLTVFCTFAHIVAQTWFVLHETWHTTLFGIYYCVEVVRIENHCRILEIMCYVSILRVLSFFGTFAYKVRILLNHKTESIYMRDNLYL